MMLIISTRPDDQRPNPARKAGDRALADAIRRLRRPGLSAWAGNHPVREQPDAIESLLHLGQALRQMHRDPDGMQLRELSRRQRLWGDKLAQRAQQPAAKAGRRKRGTASPDS
ncbi:hypothetical protein [Streptomyces sp. NBC_00996]|uniref:hypothetical protein n=1 Tax=Streptomyces sp. NBC_00996 TaxID=2903710 RepID=UPI00386722E0|nr:hypothetical protein OG390_49030 [Streptomyces sp. NBC_00996]